MQIDEYLAATSDNKPDHCDIDISRKAFWARPADEKMEIFAALRAEHPVSWQRPIEGAVVPDPDDPGFWAVVRHADIRQVSHDNRTFISGQGVMFDRLPPLFLEMALSFLAMDPPRHDKLRRLVNKAFTPRQITRIEDKIDLVAKEVVDGFIADPTGEIEFMDRCASRLPLRMFCEMFGVPDHLEERTVEHVIGSVSWSDEEILAGRSAADMQLESIGGLHQVAQEIIEMRRQQPGDDIISSLVHAEIDGQMLTDFEISSFFCLLSGAATDTTKTTLGHAVRALSLFPEQHAWLLEDFDNRIGTAVEEFIRWATPLLTFTRTAAVETELGGRRIMPGDRVVMIYQAGNFDEDVFDLPRELDLSRSPNPHVSFGGGGVHYCLGANLARSMLRAELRELLLRITEFETDAPDMLATNFIHGLKRLPFRFTPQ
ncbi:cytochrome P450 [Mycolicibacterium austroafricanum]|uniref:Cytochrome P450 n=2 Tax=Mycolicibacterium TaxID=1866885 RepID=A0ABT8HJ79_MYCAO|nr:cytochrome P450 [Mycolicibacterium austroafricanum]MDN4520823.1 cytochrome P450 [Mycolicibacterium austroafricanum]QRZ05138.1 cytochrome P450 [Mycolicibacterium austroafricanum]QZT66702.1 cytochrome P450 [Mycolicibacterium austroafricanum]